MTPNACEIFRTIAPIAAVTLYMFVAGSSVIEAQDRSGAKEIIANHCIECHRVPGYLAEARDPDLKAPGFQDMADDPKTYTAERLTLFLRRPHFPMPGVNLSESDIQSIVGFISELRTGSDSLN